MACSLSALVFAWSVVVAGVLGEHIKVTELADTSNKGEFLMSLFVGDTSIAFSNVSVKGVAQQFGTFAGGQDTLNINQGFVMTTGSVRTIDHINEGQSNSGFGTPGDGDLSSLMNVSSTKDSAALEFDFVPQSDIISFSYVFASDEYDEYVGSAFNDVFALIINGENCATLPSGEYVSINNVNALKNQEFFRSNINGEHAFEFDGFTTVLQCTANVTAGANNHAKLVIADVTDHTLDSAVFLMKDSFSSEVCFDGIDNNGDGSIDESCPRDTTLVRCAEGRTDGAAGVCLTPSLNETEEAASAAAETCRVVPCMHPAWVADESGTHCCGKSRGHKWTLCEGAAAVGESDMGRSVCCSKRASMVLVPDMATEC